MKKERRLEPEEILNRAALDLHVMEHSKKVMEVALRFTSDLDTEDKRLVHDGALLHDVGRGITHSLSHGLEGAQYLRSLGVEEPLARIVECHVGAGLTADDYTLQGLPPIDCIPFTLPEKIVAHADNLVKGIREISFYERFQKNIALPKRIQRRYFKLYLEMELWL